MSLPTTTSTRHSLKARSWVNLTIVVAILLAGVTAASLRVRAQTYPLKVSANKRYLVDQRNLPFFYHADTAWQLFTKLTKAEAEQYLEDRRSKGFNAIQVQILTYAPRAAVNRERQAPFINNDMTKPNDAYFAHVDWVVNRAAQKGLLMVMSSAWFGNGADGWHNSLNTSNARTYGRYLGKRYRNFNNVVWIQGGDDPVKGKLEAVRKLAAGIEETAPQQLQTYHDAERASSQTLNDENWLDINMTYSRSENYAQVLNEYNRKPVRPIVDGENQYVDGNNNAFVGRKQAYWVMLSGAAGHAYGIEPVWSLEPGWQKALNDRSAFQMGHLKNLFASRAWYNLKPDQTHTVVTDGYGKFSEDNYVTAACTADGSLLIAYLPEGGSLTVDLSKFKGSVKAQWFDPTNGSYKEAGSFKNFGKRTISSPGSNGDENRDWLLVVESGG